MGMKTQLTRTALAAALASGFLGFMTCVAAPAKAAPLARPLSAATSLSPAAAKAPAFAAPAFGQYLQGRRDDAMGNLSALAPRYAAHVNEGQAADEALADMLNDLADHQGSPLLVEALTEIESGHADDAFAAQVKTVLENALAPAQPWATEVKSRAAVNLKSPTPTDVANFPDLFYF